MIKAVKCPKLNLSYAGGFSAPTLEVLVKFNAKEEPVGIMGCPKYDSENKVCKIKKVECLYSKRWEEF